MENFNRTLKLYFAIGIGAFILDFTIFNILFYYLDTIILYSNFFGYISGLFFSFTLNRNLNFKKKDKTIKRFVSFGVISFLGLILGTMLIYLFSLLFYTWISKIISGFVVFIFQYLMNRNLTFK